MESMGGGQVRSGSYGGEEFCQYGAVSAAPETGSSFTALLELPANQAMELLVHSPACEETPTPLDNDSYYPCPPPPPIFPSDTGLIDRASKFSVFAATESSSEMLKVKQEMTDSDSSPHSSPANSNPTVNQKSTKRKEREKKGKESNKKNKKGGNDTSEEVGEKLPYVHVRARRGQATDSHSLAERARREKINARMKLLQELVPGCNKITGTAMVLDEIINHVQSLQRQVEYLSMRLAAVNPRIDFNLDSLLAAESGSPVESNFPCMVMPSIWPGGQINGNRQQYQQLWHFDGLHQPLWSKEEDNSSFVTPDHSLLSYDSPANSVSLHSNQIKMEL